MKVTDFIFKKNLFPKKFCTEILKEIKKANWKTHEWYNPVTDSLKSFKTKELDVLFITNELQEKFNPYMISLIDEYKKKFSDNNLMQTFTSIRFNRYSKGTLMREHYDHIHSIFDGNNKGIPVLSFVGNLNEDYVGGDLIIRGKSMNLKTGDICVFPSCFLYPHEVTEVKKGTRYSFVSWGF